jgi:ferrous iron transport protein A
LYKTVDKLRPGEQGIVAHLGGSGALRRHIIDMGITPGAVVIMRKTAPLGDPLEINVRGYELSLRKSEAQHITVGVDIDIGIGAGVQSPGNRARVRKGRRHGH